MRPTTRRSRLAAGLGALTLASGLLAWHVPAATADGGSPPDAPAGLTVNDRDRHLNVEGTPQFGWLPQDEDGNEIQTAYQLRVFGPTGQEVWDSGKVVSSEQSYVEYGGPSLDSGSTYSWSVRTWDRTNQASPWADPGAFDTALSDADWQAAWIRRDSDERDDYTLARKEIEIGASPIVRARLYASAYHQYRAYLNGTEVDDGPAFSYPGEGYYQATDVTDAIEPGQPLTIGLVYHWYGSGQGRPSADRRLLAQLVVEHEDGSREVIGTDGGWRVRRASQWEQGTPYRNSDAGDYVERIDAREEPVGWMQPGYDDTTEPWADATVLGKHPEEAGDYAALQGQEPRLTKRVVHPVSVTTLPDGAVVADFGTVIPARPVIHFDDGESGRVIDIQTSFLLADDGHVSTSRLATQRSDMSARYIQRGGEETFEPYTHWAWQYVQINSPGADEELDADNFWAIVEHTDAPADRAAHFESSDQMLNEVWELVKRSSIYTVQQQFVDTATREKGQFLGDTVDISYATMAAWFERDATQKAIREFMYSQDRYWDLFSFFEGRLNAVYPNGDGRRDIPDYTEMFVNWVWHYYEQTGDRALLEEAYPVMRNVADYVWRHRDDETGLIHNLSGGSGSYRFGIVDWPPPGRFDYDMNTVARTTVNIFGVEALRRVADAANVLNRPAEEAADYREREESLREAINTELRNDDGLYVDGLKNDLSQSTHVSQHANSYAIAFDIAPPGAWPELADYITSLGMHQGPMTAHWLLQALSDAERPAAVLDLLTNTEDYGWGNIIAKGGTHAWESWQADEGDDSMSHGWGSQAAVDVLGTMLGVRIADPGAETIEIVIPRDVLDHAEGTVPTQRGDVAVSWRRHPNGGVIVHIDVPVNVQARVSIPEVPGLQYKAAGAGQATFVGVEDGREIFEVGSGRTNFVAVPDRGRS